MFGEKEEFFTLRVGCPAIHIFPIVRWIKSRMEASKNINLKALRQFYFQQKLNMKRAKDMN